MPYSKTSPPDWAKNLPAGAQAIAIATFNNALKQYNGNEEAARRVAWAAVKEKYHKKGEEWVARKAEVSPALCEFSMVITKASIQPDGSVRWQATTSDTSPDSTGESASLQLFQDWISRVDKNMTVDWLPPPRKPFLGISHYSDLDGYGEAGLTDKMYIDGDRFKAGGISLDNLVGRALFETLRQETDLTRRGRAVAKPVRISAAWWDIAHSHGPFIFERKSLTEVCPVCEKGEGNKVYLKGQLDHFAATRVPINPRTSLVLQEKSSMAITRRDDAATIIGEDLAEELETKSKLVGKSEAAGLVVKARSKQHPDEETPEEEATETPQDEAMEEEEMDKMHKKMHKARTIIPIEEADYLDDDTEPVPPGGIQKLKEGPAKGKPLGGAITMSEARAHPVARGYTRLELMSLIKRNIITLPEAEQLAALSALVDEVGSEVQQIKQAVEDVWLLQPEVDTQESDIAPMDYLDTFAEKIATALGSDQPKEQKAAVIQEALNGVAAALKAELEAPEPGMEMAQALKAALAPLSEQIAQLNARLGAVQAPVVTLPVQRSVTAPPAVNNPAQPQLPTSPITGQPSQLTAQIRRSVGIY